MSLHLTKKNLTKSTLFSLLWQYTSVFTQALLQILVLAILARLLSPEDFGLLGIAMIFVGFAAIFSQLGVGPAIIQRSEITPTHIRVGFTLSILLSVVLCLLLWAFTPITARFFQNDRLTEILPVISLNFFFAGFGVVAGSLLRRNLLFHKLMWVDVGSYLFGYALIGITLAQLGYGVWALVAATLSQSLLKSILLFISQPHPITPSISRQEFRDLIHFGGGFTLARVLNYSANQGDYLIVGRFLGPELLGLYTRAYQLMMLPGKYFGEVLNTVMFPVMATIQNKRPQLAKTYLTGIAMVSLVCLPISVLMVTVAPEIVQVILGSKWLDVIIPFQILAIGILPRVSYKLDDTLAKALGVMYRRSLRDAIYVVAVVTGSLLGLMWGLPGVAFGVLCAVITNYILATSMSLNLLNCSWSEVFRAQVPGAYLAIGVTFVAVSTRSLLYANGMSPLIILLITMFVSGISIIGLFLSRPQTFGIYGIDVFQRVLSMLPEQLSHRAFPRWQEARTRHV
jgi:O-antigen/teichoic acid export membrane protein